LRSEPQSRRIYDYDEAKSVWDDAAGASLFARQRLSTTYSSYRDRLHGWGERTRARKRHFQETVDYVGQNSLWFGEHWDQRPFGCRPATKIVEMTSASSSPLNGLGLRYGTFPQPPRVSSKNSKANRIETGERSGRIRRKSFGGSRRKIAKKIADHRQS
jgi:hypothetical protein